MVPASHIKAAAQACGFTLVGLAPAAPLDARPLESWLARGMAASMGWMGERISERLDPRLLLPGARTVVALACCYLTREHARASPIAGYARGRDYHATLRDRLRALRRELQRLAPGSSFYGEVDTGPVLEKVWAERAGLGWIGKNGMLITRSHGSHVMLAVALTDLAPDHLDQPHPMLCGTCASCVSACPTGAIVEPGVVDARACLSHQTIEDRAAYAQALRARASGTAFGCDLCQTCCPWNRDGHRCDDPRFLPREIASLSLEALAELDPGRWKELTSGCAVARAQYDGLRRNALIALGAAANPAIADLAERLASDPSPAVADAASWALARVRR